MTDGQRLVLVLAQMIELLRSKPHGIDEAKDVLRSLAEMTTRQSWTVRLRGADLVIEGVGVLADTSPVPLLVTQMSAHEVSEIHFAQGVSAQSLMHLLKALAVDSGGYQGGDGVAKRLVEGNVRRIHVLAPEGDETAAERRAQRVTDAMAASGVQEESEEAVSEEVPAVAPSSPTPPPTTPPVSIEELIQQIRSGRVAVGVAAKRMRSLKAGQQLTAGLDAISVAVGKAVKDNRNDDAIEATLSVILQEKEAQKEDIRICCGVALRRMLGTENLRSFTTLLIDPLYVDDLLVILGRAGPNATQLLLDLLVGAPTFAERRTYMMALVKLGEGTSNVVAMLNHREWYVVRNIADLIAELGIEEAIPALGKVVGHSDARVRMSVATALARIGTPAAARHLHTSLRDEDPKVRLTVAKELKGAALSGLVMPMVNELEREEDPAVREELCRALGRIGTPDAVRTLENVARRKGNVFTQQRPGGDRRAAVEGLVLVGGDVARQALLDLQKDRDKEVRNAVQEGLQRITSKK
jgi:HEAT repeat protein